MVRDIERRDFVKGVGVAGIVGLAGCTGGNNGGNGNGSSSTSSSGGSSSSSSSSGNSSSSSSSGGSGNINRSDAIKYGVLLPQTGDLASTGKLMVNAAVLPTKQLKNADLGGLKVQNQVEDTQTDPSSGISAANSLVNSGIPGVCGPASSGVNIQVSKQVFIPNQVVGCSPSSTAPSVTNLDDNGFIFRTAPSDALQGKVMGQVATNKLSAKTAATMYVNNDYGQLLSQSFAKAFKNKGGSVQKQVSFEKEQSSYTSKLQSALGGNPDLLVVVGYPQSGVQLFKDFYSDFDNGTKILVTDGMQDPKMQKQVGNPMKNLTGTAPNPSGPASDAFTKAYKKEYNRAPGVFNAHSYDSAAVLILANAMAGKNDGKAVRDNMDKVANPGGMEVTVENLAEGVKAAAQGKDVNYQGASSPVDFDKNGDMKTVSYAVWKFQPGSDSVKVTDTIEYGGSS